MSDYATELKAHLADYKRDVLRIEEDGVWRNNNRPYEHILPFEHERHNILDSIRDAFWAHYEANRATLGLHTDFHHLNSSQAFAINLLFPWMSDAMMSPVLLDQLGVPGARVEQWAFEHMPDHAERTSVDLHVELTGGARLLVEVKLTESTFGQVFPKDSHRLKRQDVYLSRLEGKVRPAMLEESMFFLNYQLLRNLSHLNLAHGDRLVLLLPKANAFTWLHGQSFMAQLSDAARGAVRMIAVEDLVAALEGAASGSKELSAHMAQVRRKYLPAG